MEKKTKFSIIYYIVVFLLLLFLQMLFFSTPRVKEISYKQFRDYLAADRIEKVIITDARLFGLLKVQQPADTSRKAVTGKAEKFPHFPAPPWRLKWLEREPSLQRQFMVIKVEDPKLIEDLQAHGVDYRARITSNWLKDFFLNWVLPFLFLVMLWAFFIRRMGAGPGVLDIGKSKVRIYAEDPKNRVTFADVAGIDEAVEEVKEIVEFLKNPQKFTRLGAKLPRGVLLVGPPGTGKTLLARAVAGEAGVPFFSLSGSDFVEMFVGVGAARVRDLFAQAKAKAPCIIFIDELDAIGKRRGGAISVGGHDERENTLNQLLVEMDGFDPTIGVILMGATNRPDVLDPALLRPGRFDRQILVDRPDLKGREAIFRVHTRKLILGEDVDLHKLAAQTPGFAGAEIANVCNEAALLASRKGHNKIKMEDFQEAIERIVAGLEKKNKLINPRERRIVAYHESGHAIVGHFTPGADPVQKVSIVPRGFGALGYTLQTPLEDRYLMTRSELMGKIKGLLGGRAAEELVFGEVSTGASNDLERATRIARNMIVMYGMSERVPNISLVERDERNFLEQGSQTMRRSEKIEEIIDEEVLEIIRICYQEDKALLQEKRDKLEEIAQTLLEKETIDEEDIVRILGPRPETVDAQVANSKSNRQQS